MKKIACFDTMGAVLGGNKTLPDGRRVYAYTRATRDHGITM